MSTPIYLLGKTPLVILGLESVLNDTSYNFKKSFLLGKDEFCPNCSSAFLLFVQLNEEKSKRFTCLKRIIKNYPLARLIVLHDTTDVKHIKACFRLGVSAYLLSSICAADVRKAIQAVSDGQTYLDPILSQYWASQTMGLGNDNLSLTRREKEVLNLIVEEYTTKEIAKQLYISPCTAETHRMNIIHKMGVRNTAGVVREAVRMGW
ncbi:response regulator transcription factor [Lewinella cohaerens]|uniref:response regulator transcription factor n=1 Tax=Lewinella cohaerens TaxID=70995 RepID=UPI00036A810F|nr:response regulator transcription factor [Lewinella cohaerens]